MDDGKSSILMNIKQGNKSQTRLTEPQGKLEKLDFFCKRENRSP